jgi:hypothetical protein
MTDQPLIDIQRQDGTWFRGTWADVLEAEREDMRRRGIPMTKESDDDKE